MSLPQTLGELQLYRVLQRANLLMYYDTFIQQGGDDVQQLCEAGEDEFLEIMALVGMATKPLHVRRLQKALHDWTANPTVFNQPLSTNMAPCGIPFLRIDSSNAALSEVMGSRKSLSNGQPGSLCDREEQGFCPNNSPKSACSQASPGPPDHLKWDKLTIDPHLFSPEMYGAVGVHEDQPSPPLLFTYHPRLLSPSTPTFLCSPSAEISHWLGGQLDPETVKAVEESVDRLLRTMPQADQTEMKTLLRLNKKLAKTVGHIFNLKSYDKSKEEEIRKYSLIYDRFECKRREGKQLTHHEMLINEAAAQFCIRDNTLLLRRVELFSLARQAVRECAYTSTLKHNRTYSDDFSVPVDCTVQKRIKHDVADSDGISFIGLSKDIDPVANADIRLSTDDNSLSGESLDSLTQDISLQMPHSSLPYHLTDATGLIKWNRQLMQQTLMDEGLRLARMVSCDHASNQGSMQISGEYEISTIF